MTVKFQVPVKIFHKTSCLIFLVALHFTNMCQSYLQVTEVSEDQQNKPAAVSGPADGRVFVSVALKTVCVSSEAKQQNHQIILSQNKIP